MCLASNQSEVAMQKIMYDDNYGLTEATLHELKDMTRRIAYNKELKNELHTGWDESGHLIMCDGWMQVARSKYAVGEEVAIAQSYKTLLESEYMPADIEDAVCELVRQGHAGCTNKMFVKAELMPKRIRITAIKLERLQDISDKDCLREGIYKHNALPDALGEDRYKFISYAYEQRRTSTASANGFQHHAKHLLHSLTKYRAKAHGSVTHTCLCTLTN